MCSPCNCSKFNARLLEHFPNESYASYESRRKSGFATWFRKYATKYPQRLSPIICEMALGPSRQATSWTGSFSNGFRFHTYDYGDPKTVQNYGMAVSGNDVEYYGIITDIVTVTYMGRYRNNTVTLYKGTWFDPTAGVRFDEASGLTDVKWNSRLQPADEPFILASQAEQVGYIKYPHKSHKAWRNVLKMVPRFEIQCDVRRTDVSMSTTINDGVDEPLQETTFNEPIIPTDASELDSPNVLVDLTQYFENATLVEEHSEVEEDPEDDVVLSSEDDTV